MNIGVVGNARYAGLQAILHGAHAAAVRLGVRLQTEPDLQSLWPAPVPLMGETPLDALLTFGGDGTLLRGARILDGKPIPILGVNLGRVGFLTTAGERNYIDALDALVHKTHHVEERQLLQATIQSPRGDAQELPTALNDLVIHKSGIARLVRLQVRVDDIEAASYSADGLIVATPTGSTAYSLSAGGPIIVPGVKALVITPICAHTLAVRPVVISSSSVVTVIPLDSRKGNLMVSIDGQKATTLHPGHRVVVRRGEGTVVLARLSRSDYFQRMRETLHWGDLSERERPI